MNTRRILTFILVILLLSIISIFYNPSPTGNAIKQTDYPKETAILERVIDGDTIVYRIGNISQSCRLLGINTPEKKMPYANEAANYLRQFENKTIQLQRDSEDTDKYKRKLRYLFYDNQMINLEILEQGFANIYYENGLKYQKELQAAEDLARTQALGIWTKSQEKCSTQNCISLEEINAKEEFFILKNSCSFECDLSGWFVKDAGRNIFELKQIAFNEEQTYNSKNGTNIWNDAGDKFFMFDEKGLLVMYYVY